MPSATAALVPLTASSSASLRDFIFDAGALTAELMAQTATLVDDVVRQARAISSVTPVVFTAVDSAAEWACQGVPNSFLLKKPFSRRTVDNSACGPSKRTGTSPRNRSCTRRQIGAVQSGKTPEHGSPQGIVMCCSAIKDRRRKSIMRVHGRSANPRRAWRLHASTACAAMYNRRHEFAIVGIS